MRIGARDNAVIGVLKVNARAETALFFSNDFIDTAVVSYASKQVHLRKLLHEVFSVALGQAACHYEQRVLFARLMQFKDGVEALLFSRPNEAASVDNKHISGARVVGEGIGFELAQHDFAIDKVFVTA